MIILSGADPGFQVRGGALKKIAPSGGRREKCWGISCEKSRFYAKKSNFFQLRREARKVLGISCEKSRFYANFRWGGPAPPPGSAPVLLYIYILLYIMMIIKMAPLHLYRKNAIFKLPLF